MKRFFQSWMINTLAVLVAVYVVKGLRYQTPLDLVVASLILGVLNAVLRPVLMLLALPLLVFSLGLFTLVINAGLLYFVGNVMQPHFQIDSFRAAFWGALVISLVSVILNTLTGTGGSRMRLERKRSHHRDGPDGGGPIIDV